MYEIIYKIYDFLNKNKDYNSECEFIISKVKVYNKFNIKKMLDIGCGTGNHLQYLSKYINNGIGIDISKEMIDVASKKEIPNVKFIHSSVENLSDSEFDLITLLFQVVNHIHDLSKLILLFKSISNKINSGGILIFDVFNCLAMLLDKPNNEIRNIHDRTIEIKSNFDAFNSNLSIHYNYKDNTTNESFNYSLYETIWSPFILKQILNETGFKICEIKKNFTEEDISINTYKLTFICKKT